MLLLRLLLLPVLLVMALLVMVRLCWCWMLPDDGVESIAQGQATNEKHAHVLYVSADHLGYHVGQRQSRKANRAADQAQQHH